MRKITLFFTLFAFTFGFAQNGGDDCGSAVEVFSGVQVTATTINDVNVGTNGDDSAWFFFTATADGTISVNSCLGGADTDLQVWDGCAGAVIASNDDFCEFNPGSSAWASSVEGVAVTNGNTYYIEWIDTWELGPFNWQLDFLTCAPPSGTVANVDDCNNSQFTIDVDVTDMGDSATLTISTDFDGTTYPVAGTGITNIGPFPVGTPVVVTLEHESDPTCNVSSGAVTDTCPPSNDECAGAIAVTCDETVTGSTAGATDSGGNSNAANDVWYSYTGPGFAEDVTLTLCNSGYDTAIRVYTDCSVTQGAQVLFNDDSCGTRSEGTFASDGTTTYYIMIEGWNTSSGDYEMTVTCNTFVPAPPNDECSNAQALTLDTLTGGTTAGATDDSTGSADDTSCEGFTFKSDVWYTFVAPDTDVSIVTAITGDSDQANVAVYSSTDCSQLDADSIACSSGNGGESIDVTGLTPAATYYVRVWSDGVALGAPPVDGGSRIEGTFNITVNDALLSTTSVEFSGFQYYPNPVNNKLTMNAQNNIQNVTVYNILGQEVLKVAPNAVNSELDMDSLSKGAYFVKVTINNVTETIRIIKK